MIFLGFGMEEQSSLALKIPSCGKYFWIEPGMEQSFLLCAKITDTTI